jgi:hypothetical protein
MTRLEAYLQRFEQVEREAGATSYQRLLRWIKRREDANEAARKKGESPETAVSTMRQYKSAYLHVLYARNEPMPKADADDIDFVLDGLQSKEEERPRRAALSEAQIKSVLQAAGTDQESQDFVVFVYGVCARPKDADITRSRVIIGAQLTPQEAVLNPEVYVLVRPNKERRKTGRPK